MKLSRTNNLAGPSVEVTKFGLPPASSKVMECGPFARLVLEKSTWPQLVVPYRSINCAGWSSSKTRTIPPYRLRSPKTWMDTPKSNPWDQCLQSCGKYTFELERHCAFQRWGIISTTRVCLSPHSRRTITVKLVILASKMSKDHT